MLQTCTGNEPFQVLWATHLNFYPAVIPINLVVKTIYPVATRQTLYPDETLTFQISSSTAEAVAYQLNFGDDSASLITTDTEVGYSWSVGGQYTVNVTAITRSNVESRALVVSVVAAVNTGTPPIDLTVKADWDRKTDFGITAYVAVNNTLGYSIVNYVRDLPSRLNEVDSREKLSLDLEPQLGQCLLLIVLMSR